MKKDVCEQVEKCDSINFIIKINFKTDLSDMLTCKSRTFIRLNLPGAFHVLVPSIHRMAMRKGEGVYGAWQFDRIFCETREIVACKSTRVMFLKCVDEQKCWNAFIPFSQPTNDLRTVNCVCACVSECFELSAQNSMLKING